jgi:hypothetical protein
MLWPKVTSVFRSEDPSRSWRAYRQADGTLAIVAGVEVSGEPIAGPGPLEAVNRQLGLLAGDLLEASCRFTYRIDPGGFGCPAGYCVCGDGTCCPVGKTCVPHPPYCE